MNRSSKSFTRQDATTLGNEQNSQQKQRSLSDDFCSQKILQKEESEDKSLQIEKIERKVLLGKRKIVVLGVKRKNRFAADKSSLGSQKTLLIKRKQQKTSCEKICDRLQRIQLHLKKVDQKLQRKQAAENSSTTDVVSNFQIQVPVKKLFKKDSKERLSGSLSTSQKLPRKIRQIEQQLLRLMDSDSDKVFPCRSLSPISKLCEKIKVQKLCEGQRIDKDELSTIKDTLNNPFSNNWQEYQQTHLVQSFSQKIEISSEEQSQVDLTIFHLADDKNNKVVEQIQKIYGVLINKQTNLSEILSSMTPEEFFNLLRTAQGSKLMQDILKKHRDLQIVTIMQSKILRHIRILMTDKYGNYFIQELCKYQSFDQKQEFIDKIDIVHASQNPIGTHCLQAFYETMNKSLELLNQLVLKVGKLLPNEILHMVQDQNSCHVIKKIFAMMKPIDFRKHAPVNLEMQTSSIQLLQMFYQAVKNTFLQTCTSQYGVVAIKEILQLMNQTRLNGPQNKQHSNCQNYEQFLKVKFSFYQEIVVHFVGLSKDCYGNYITQELLDQPQNNFLCDDLQKEITTLVVQHFYDLSMQKYASNVVDKCIHRLNKQHISTIIVNLTDNLKDTQIANLIISDYANFVIKNLFNRNKQIKSVPFLDKMEESLKILHMMQNCSKNEKQQSVIKREIISQLEPVSYQLIQKLHQKWKNYVQQQRQNLIQKSSTQKKN